MQMDFGKERPKKVRQVLITDYGLIVIEVNEDEGSEHGGFGGRVIKLDINYCLSTLIY